MAEEPPAKKAKGGFKGMDCPFAKSEFLSQAKAIKIELEVKPKVFGPGGYGWQKGGGIKKIEAEGDGGHGLKDKPAYVRPSCIAQVFGSKGDGKEVDLPTKKFMSKAEPWTASFEAEPVEFSTGSFGWHAHSKRAEVVDGKPLQLQVNLNAPINGSKDKGEEEPEDPALADIDANAIVDDLKIIGRAEAKDRDDLTKLRGIGPWIEKRLNKIGIYTFKQISLMTPEIEDRVNVAIKYFLGRVRRDEWVLQAQKMVGGKYHELKPLVATSSGTVKIDGNTYEQKLIEIAKHAMADGVIELFEAEALWFSASDGSKVTDIERQTLDYIMTADSFKVESEAEEYLKKKLNALSAGGVTPAK
jgi:predicted flap endonuclease-1-like 5' DNA nuclease